MVRLCPPRITRWKIPLIVYSVVLPIALVSMYNLRTMAQHIRVTSFNCSGAKNKLPIISDLCNKADLIFLQETWLLPIDLEVLENINDEFTSFSLSAVDLHDGILIGRPYGCLSVMWNRKLSTVCKVVLFDDQRIMGVALTIDEKEYYL